MHNTSRIGLTLLTLGAFALAAAHPAKAQGSLMGAYYHAPTGSTSSLADAQAYLNTHAASGYFSATQSTLAAGYFGRDDSLITSFLGTDGVSFTGTAGNLSDGIINLTGSVIVTTPGSYTFSTSTDDGSSLFIDGVQVVNNDGLHNSQSVVGTASLGTGMHSVNVLYFDHGLLPAQNGFATLGVGFGPLTVSPLPAPEPSSVATFAVTGLGVLGAAFKARKRRVSA